MTPITLGVGPDAVEVEDGAEVPLMGDVRARTKTRLWRTTPRKVQMEWPGGWSNVSLATGKATRRAHKVAVDLPQLRFDRAIEAWLAEKDWRHDAPCLAHLFDCARALGYGKR